MGSSLPAAMDWLVAHIKDLPIVTSGSVVVVDGWPAARGDQQIVLGITPEQEDVSALGSYAALDRGVEHETVEVPSIIAVRFGGTDSMSRARARAFALLDAVAGLIRQDRRLGGAIRPGLPARIDRWAASPTADTRQAGEGRVCEIRWWLTWQHRG